MAGGQVVSRGSSYPPVKPGARCTAPPAPRTEQSTPKKQKSVFKRLSKAFRKNFVSQTPVEGIPRNDGAPGRDHPLRQAIDLECHRLQRPQRLMHSASAGPMLFGDCVEGVVGPMWPHGLDWRYGTSSSLPCGMDSSPSCDRWSGSPTDASTSYSSHCGPNSSPSPLERTPSNCSQFTGYLSNSSTPRSSSQFSVPIAPHCFVTAEGVQHGCSRGNEDGEVFMLYASPVDQQPIDVTAEAEVLSQAITESNAHIDLRIGVATARSLTKLLTLARSRRGVVLHLSAHAVEGGPNQGVGLVLEDASGHSHVLWREQLEELLGMREQGLRNISLLFLSTCYSEQLAEIFVECGCRHVVAVREKVHDAAARRFSQQFYLSLAMNQPLLDAWEGARRALRIDPEKTLAVQAEHFVLFGQHGSERATLSSLCGAEVQQSPEATLNLRDFEASDTFLRTKLPPRAENFIGRATTIYELMTAFAGSRGRRACAVHGPEGIGKTALGAEFAHFAAAPGRIFSCATITIKIETPDLDGIVNKLEEQLEILATQLRVPVRTMSGTSRVSRDSSISHDSRGSACSMSARSDSLNSLDISSEDPLAFLLPAQTRIRRALQSLERHRGRTARTLLIIDDEAGAMSNSPEARRLLGDLLEHTYQLHTLILSREPVYKSLGSSKVANLRLDSLSLTDASMLFLQRIHRPLDQNDFPPREWIHPTGPGPGGGNPRIQRADLQHLCQKLSSHRLMIRLNGHPAQIHAVSSRVTPGGPSLLALAASPDLAASPSCGMLGQRGEPDDKEGPLAKPDFFPSTGLASVAKGPDSVST